MSRRNTRDNTPDMPWSVPIAADDIAEGGQRFALAADHEVRSKIAKMAGLRALSQLEADFEVTRQGAEGLRVIGKVSAVVGQNCVVTLEPLDNPVEEDIDLLFLPQPAGMEVTAQRERGYGAADSKSDDPEPLVGGVVDLGALATEFLILGIDPYPRKPDAVFEAPIDLAPEAGPFAALAGWTKGRNDG
jgi:hypothetical protein